MVVEVHDVGVSACAIAGVVEGPAFDGYVGGVDSASSTAWELSSFEFAFAELVVASEVASVVEVNVGVPAGAVNPVVTFFGSEFDGTGLHVYYWF